MLKVGGSALWSPPAREAGIHPSSWREVEHLLADGRVLNDFKQNLRCTYLGSAADSRATALLAAWRREMNMSCCAWWPWECGRIRAYSA